MATPGAGEEEDRKLMERLNIIAANENSNEFKAKMYDKRMNIAIIVSMWGLSCIVAYAFWYKNNANIDYNKLVRDHNTRRLEAVMNDLRRASAEYKKYAKGEATGDGEKLAKENLFFQIRKTSELFDKCNYIKMMNTEGAFPWAEIAVSCILLFIISGVVLWSNISNNPINNMRVQERIAALRKEIVAMDKFAKSEPIDEDFKNRAFRDEYRAKARERIEVMEHQSNLSEADVTLLNNLKMEEHAFKKEDDESKDAEMGQKALVKFASSTVSNIGTMFGKKKARPTAQTQGDDTATARRKARRMRGGGGESGAESGAESDAESVASMSGGANRMPNYAMSIPPPKVETDMFDNKQRRLELIQMKTNRLNTELNFLRSDATFNQTTITIIIVIATMYLGLTIVMNAVGYTSNLYSGRMFMQSRCTS